MRQSTNDRPLSTERAKPTLHASDVIVRKSVANPNAANTRINAVVHPEPVAYIIPPHRPKTRQSIKIVFKIFGHFLWSPNRRTKYGNFQDTGEKKACKRKRRFIYSQVNGFSQWFTVAHCTNGPCDERVGVGVSTRVATKNKPAHCLRARTALTLCRTTWLYACKGLKNICSETCFSFWSLRSSSCTSLYTWVNRRIRKMKEKQIEQKRNAGIA